MDKVTSIGKSGSKTPARRTESSVRLLSPELEREIYQYRLQGKSLSEISELLDLDLSSANRALQQRFVQEAAFLTDIERTSILALEVARLDALQDAVWPSAMMGDPKSVDSAVKIILARARVQGLDAVDPVVQKQLVLVMGEKEEDYIAALKQATSD